MARYKGPKSKIARKFREPIFGPDKALEKKNYPPGVHGPNKRRMKRSEYAIQLAEKQKAKYTYGILERQFSNMFKKASSKSGITGEILLQLCEMRLDNVVFRLGISPSRRGARQLVTHRHIAVNGKIVNIPSYSLRVGDVVGVREKSNSLQVVTASLNSDHNVTEWLLWDSSAMSGEVKAEPSREQITENIKELSLIHI